MKLDGLTFNFLGDSITLGVGTTHNSCRYFELLKANCGLTAANGFGISGTRLAKQITPSDEPLIDRFFASRINEMPDADGVVIFGGTNDFGHGDAPIGTFADRTPDTFYGACHDLYTRLIEKYPGKPIIIMTPLHRTDENNIRMKHGQAVTLKTYVDIIREVAEYYSLPVCDLYKNSCLQPLVSAVMDAYVPDGLHPNDAGHIILAERLENFLRAL